MSEENKTEIWRTYPEIDFIQGSNLGNVRTVDRTVMKNNGRRNQVKGQILKQYLTKWGYMEVSVRANKKTVHLKVHRIVALCFLPNPGNLPQVNHKDCNRTNNNVDNLEWCDASYNARYREKYGVSRLEACGRPLIAVNLKTLKVLYFKSHCEAGYQLKISPSNITKVLKGKRKTAGGFWFVSADPKVIESTREKFDNSVANKVSKLIECFCKE